MQKTRSAKVWEFLLLKKNELLKNEEWSWSIDLCSNFQLEFTKFQAEKKFHLKILINYQSNAWDLKKNF